jgi:hypothetical protein
VVGGSVLADRVAIVGIGCRGYDARNRILSQVRGREAAPMR